VDSPILIKLVRQIIDGKMHILLFYATFWFPVKVLVVLQTSFFRYLFASGLYSMRYRIAKFRQEYKE